MRWLSRPVAFLSGEWVLHRHANGSGPIVARTFLTSLVLFSVILGITNVVDPERSWVFDRKELQAQVRDGLPLLLTIMAGTYAVFYARFSSQWTYLANVYNSIKESQVQTEHSKRVSQSLAEWKAAFIEDANELHLASKPAFAATIVSWSECEQTRAAFTEHAPGGAEHLDHIVSKARNAIRGSEAERRLAAIKHQRGLSPSLSCDGLREEPRATRLEEQTCRHPATPESPHPSNER